MSSNNQLVIIKEGRKYRVYLDGCVDNEFIPTKDDILFTTTRFFEIVSFAKRYCRDNLVEYGFDIDKSCYGKEEKDV